MIQSFKIDYPKNKSLWTKEYGLNRYYAGKHWTKRQQDANYWHLITKAATRCLKMFENPVIITFYFNDRLDIVNHATFAKMIEDGLKGVVIQDDDRRFVVGHEYYFFDKDYILVEMREV